MPVARLRQLARQLPDAQLKGRQVSRANKGELIAELRRSNGNQGEKIMIDTIAKSLRESLHIAADLAGDMTRIARARLDIASTKKDIRFTQAALGAFVHENPDADGPKRTSAGSGMD